MPSKIKRVLIVHPFGIGDVLFVTPIIRALHENGVEKIDLLLGSRTKELFIHNPLVNEIFVLDRDVYRSKSPLGKISQLLSLISKLKARRYDTFLDFSLSRQYAAWAFFALWIPRRIGFNYKNRGTFLTQKLPLPKSFSGKHVVEHYMDLLDLASFSSDKRSLELSISDEELQNAKQTLKAAGVYGPFIAIAPGGGESWGKDARLKRWPVIYFAELFSKIRTNAKGEQFSAVILGGKNEWQLGESLKDFLPGRSYNLCGKLPLLESAALLKSARFLLANDGGLVHIAAALNVPVVALFGPVDPKVYGPYPESKSRIAVTNEGPECRPCYQNMRYQSDCQHIDCLNTLSPDRVYSILESCGFLNLITEHVSQYE